MPIPDAGRSGLALNVRVRAARLSDAPALLTLACSVGAGFTSLPPRRTAIEERLDASERACASQTGAGDGDAFWLVAESLTDGAILGSAAIFARVGTDWPFYSFRRGRVTHASPALKTSTTYDVLHLVNDLNGVTEVGGLLVQAGVRGSGLGALLARARYLFMAASPDRFCETVMAELRGWQDEAGASPFWNALGRHFFPMSFAEADRFGAIHGNQFIADLLPRLPLYEALLPGAARAVIGLPHNDSRGAAQLLQREGFRHEGLVDVFDAGPCFTCRLADIATVRQRQDLQLLEVNDDVDRSADQYLISSGALQTFTCVAASGQVEPDGFRLVPAGADALAVDAGARISVASWRSPSRANR
jgi:arginine N-succinyltransferase